MRFPFGRRSLEMHRARTSLLHSASLSARSHDLLAAVALPVHRRDTMYERGRAEHYLSVGLSAMTCIDVARGPARAPDTVLDFASGYGRVLRFLRVAFPKARLAASDIEGEAMRFCARSFGVPTFLSPRDPGSLELGERFDLIWCGSLITHLDRASATRLLEFFAAHLTRGGLCVLSAHGEVTASTLRDGPARYGLSEAAARGILAGVDQTGFGYADYQGHRGYGVSLARRETMATMAGEVGLREAGFQARAWDDHHDVYAFSGSVVPASSTTSTSGTAA